MRVSNTNYDARNLLEHKARFILDVGLADDYVSGEFSGRLTTQKLLLHLPEMSSTELRPLYPSLKLMGNLRVEVLDELNAITNLVANNSILGRSATLKALFEELTETDAINLFQGNIIDYRVMPGFQSYQFLMESAFPALDKQIFTGLAETQLNGQLSSYHFSTFTDNAPAAGTNVWVEVARNIEGIEIDDNVYLEHPTNPTIREITKVKETRINTTNKRIDIKVDLVNSYPVLSTVNSENIGVDDTTAFPLTVPANPPFKEGLYLLVGREIIKYISKNDAGGFFSTDTTRTYFNSLRQRHRDNEKVKECWLIRDNPITLMLNIMTTTSGGTNGAYDLGIANFGAGMDETKIDFAAAENIRDTYFLNDEFKFIIAEPVNAAEMVIEIMRSCGIYPVASGSGILSFKKVQTVTPLVAVAIIDDNEIAVPEGEDDEKELSIEWTPGMDQLINEVEFKYDWVPGRNEYTTNRVFELVESKNQFGLTKRLVLESKGLRSSVATANFTTEYLKILAKKFGNPSPRLEMDLVWQNHLLEAGDVVKISSNIIPNLKTGARDLSNELLELVKSEPQPRRNVVRVGGYFYDQGNVVDVGFSTEASPTDNAANFNVTDSTTVQADDATYDNSADLNISAKRVIVNVHIRLLSDTGVGNQTINYHIRVGTNVHLGTMTVEAEQDYQHTWIATKYGEGFVFVNTHVFNFGTATVRDVKLDFYARSGADALNINSITLLSVVYESDGAAYVEVT